MSSFAPAFAKSYGGHSKALEGEAMARGKHETNGVKLLVFRYGKRSRVLQFLIRIHYKLFVVSRFRIGVYVAVFRGNLLTKEREILLVESWDGGLLFPGGGLDAEDISFQAAAIRELEEETGLITKSVSTYPIATIKMKAYVALVYKAGLTERDGRFSLEPLPSAECPRFEWLSYSDLFTEKGQEIKGGHNSPTWQLVHDCLKS